MGDNVHRYMHSAPCSGTPKLTFHRRKKGPDASFWVYPPGVQAPHRFPTLATEVGCSESIGDLQDDARLLLAGSAGAIKVAVLVKYG